MCAANKLQEGLRGEGGKRREGVKEGGGASEIGEIF